MSSTQKTILGFCIFALIAGSVIGYGIYRKSAAEARQTEAQHDREKNAEEAAELCKTELRDFVIQTAKERERLLNRSERVSREIREGDKSSELAEKNAQTLSTRQGPLNQVHEALKGYEDQIRNIKSMLTNLSLVEKSEQGSEQFRKGVEQAETQAKAMANNSIEGEIELSKTILRNDLDWIDKEIKTKRRQLEQHDREERLRTVKLKLESLTLGFEKKGRKALEKVLKEYQGFVEEYQDVMDEEKTLGSGLKSLILKARLAEADARDRFIAGDNQMKAQEEGRKITLLMQTYLLAGDDTGSDQAEKDINKGIKDLIKLDNDYGNALSAVFNKLQERSDKNKQNENG